MTCFLNTVKRWVIDTSLQDLLIRIFHHLLEMDRSKGLHIYTDGSMIKAQNQMQDQRIAMGVGWIIENLDLSFKCSIEHFPSSTA